MRVLQVTPFFPPDSGGISNHVYNLCKNLNNFQNEVIVIAPRSFADRTGIENMNRSIRIFKTKSIFLPGWPYQTLHSVSLPLDLGASISRVLRRDKINIIHVHGHHYPLSWLGLYYAKKFNIPCVLTLHGMYALNPNKVGGRTRFEDLFNRYIFTRILKHSSAVIGLTEGITRYAKEFDPKITTHYFTIPNGINTEPFRKNLAMKRQYRYKYGINEGSVVVLFRGRFERVKGIVEFVSSIFEIQHRLSGGNVEFVLIGSGSLESYVKSQLKNFKNVHIWSWQPLDVLHELYIASDIFIIPSKFEALPITVIEAMNAGLHIIYSAVGGLPEILQNYSPKTQLKDGSAQDILLTVLDIIQTFKPNTIDNESLLYAQRFDWQEVVAQINSAYLNIV